MSVLDNYFTEGELAAKIHEKTGKGSRRALRGWRGQRIGPPWVKFGKTIIYPIDGFEEWLRDQVQQPVRSRKRVA